MAANYDKVYYAVRIETQVTTSEPKIGLDSGIITYVTTNIPSNTQAVDGDDETITYIEDKYSGFLVVDGLGTSSSSIDILTGGDFSTLNNFNIKIKNRIADDSAAFHRQLELVENLYLTGCKVKFFICFASDTGDDVWYSRWSGFISTTTFDEKYFKMNCSDNFIQDFLTFPKDTVSILNYPDAPKSSVAKAIPVCLGDVKFAKPLSVSNAIKTFSERSLDAVLRVSPNIEELHTWAYGPTRPRLQLPDPTNPTLDRGINPTYYVGDIERQVWNGYTFCLIVKDPGHGVPDFDIDAPVQAGEGIYKEKYLVFTVDPIGKDPSTFKELESLKILNSAYWGDYLFLYIEKMPDFLVDSTNLYGEGLPLPSDPDYANAGELTMSGTFFFSIVDYTNDIVLSSKGVKEIIEPPTNNRVVLPDTGLTAFFEGNSGATQCKLPVDAVDLGSKYRPALISLAPTGYNDGKISLDTLLLPEPEKTYFFNNMVDNALSNSLDAHGSTAMSNSMSADNDSYDLIFPGGHAPVYHETYPQTIEGLVSGYGPVYLETCLQNIYDQIFPDGYDPVYHEIYLKAIEEWLHQVAPRYKTNIVMQFGVGLVDYKDYDSAYVLVNMQPEKRLYFDSLPLGSPAPLLWPCFNLDGATNYTDFTIPDTNYGNTNAYYYQMEVRNMVNTAQGLRFTQNYNTIDDDIFAPYDYDTNTFNAYWYIDPDSTGTPVDECIWQSPGVPVYGKQRIVTIPKSLVPLKLEDGEPNYPQNGYMYIWPQQPKYQEGFSYERYLQEGPKYATKSNLEIDTKVLGSKQHLNRDGSITDELVLSITPFTGETEVESRTPTWDLIRIYNMGIMLRKDIDPSVESFIRVKGEVMYGAMDTIVVTNSYEAAYDGTYTLDGTSTYYYCADTDTYIYPSPVDPTYKNMSHTLNSAGFDYTRAGGYEGSYTPAISGRPYPVAAAPDVTETETNSVYTCLKHILEDYNGLSGVDYTNLPETRTNWNVGRQVTEIKNSINYIQEICSQSFIAGFVNRRGNLTFNSFREQKAATTSAVIHNSTNIVRDSITNFRQTPISKVYNNLTVEFDWDAVAGKYAQSYSINRISDDFFPAYDTLDEDEVTPLWKRYVEGYSADSYLDAKAIWDRCHQSYLETRVQNKAPNNITQLIWSGDKANFYADGQQYDRSEEYAAKYLELLSDWATRQKLQVEYSVPVTEENVQLDLMDIVFFSDPIITGDESYAVGWITRIDFNPKDNTFDIELTFEQLKSRWVIEDYDDIIEHIDDIIDVEEDISYTDNVYEQGSE